jgi:hypothetical protein
MFQDAELISLLSCSTGFLSYNYRAVVLYLTNSKEQGPSWEANSTLRQSKNSPHFMETEGSLPCSQEPASGPYPVIRQCKFKIQETEIYELVKVLPLLTR